MGKWNFSLIKARHYGVSWPEITGGEEGLILVSSWGASAVYWIDGKGAMNRSLSGIASPADIGYDAKRRGLLVPVFNENRLEIHPR